MIKQGLIIVIFFCFNFASAQNTDVINFGSGITDFYANYSHFIKENSILNKNNIPFAYNILFENKPHYQIINSNLVNKTVYFFDEIPEFKIYTNFYIFDSLAIDYLEINNQKLSIYSLFRKYSAQYEEGVPIKFNKGVTLNVGERKFLFLEFNYNSNLASINNCITIFLFDVTNQKNIIQIPFVSAYHGSYLAFGDANNDKILDYFNLENCYLEAFTLQDSSLVINKKVHLEVKCKDVDPVNVPVFETQIVHSKSKWFFNLNNVWQNYFEK